MGTEVHGRRRSCNSSSFNKKQWCPGWESNPHEEKSPEDFKSSASAIPPPGQRAETKHSTVFAFFRVRGSGKCAALLARLRSLVKPKPKRLGGRAPPRAPPKKTPPKTENRKKNESQDAKPRPTPPNTPHC